MGVPVTTRLTVKDFLELPEEQIQHAELVDGEVVQMGFRKSRHEDIKSLLMMKLVRFLTPVPAAYVLSETMYVLNETESRMPDVSVLLDESTRKPSLDEHYRGAPDIALRSSHLNLRPT